MSNMEGLFTLHNRGEEVNCSLTSLLFPANFEIVQLKLGEGPTEQVRKGNKKVPRLWKNKQMGFQCEDCNDYVEIGGSDSLDSARLLAKSTFCECDAKAVQTKVRLRLSSRSQVPIHATTAFSLAHKSPQICGEKCLDFITRNEAHISKGRRHCRRRQKMEASPACFAYDYYLVVCST